MKFRTSLKGATAPVALAVMLAATPVLAQDTADAAAAEDDDSAATADSTDDGVIFVTGSRIRRDEFSAPAPLTVIDPQIAQRQGLLAVTGHGPRHRGTALAAGLGLLGLDLLLGLDIADAKSGRQGDRVGLE